MPATERASNAADEEKLANVLLQIVFVRCVLNFLPVSCLFFQSWPLMTRNDLKDAECGSISSPRRVEGSQRS